MTAARARQAQANASINFTADVAPLLKAVSYAGAGSMDRATLPILGNLLVQVTGRKLFVVGADMDREVEVELEAMGEIDGQTTVPLRTLNDLLRGYPAGGDVRVVLGPDDTRAVIACGRSRSMVPVLDADMFPRISIGGGDRYAFDIDTDVLERMIDMVGFASGEDAGKPFMMGVHLHTLQGEDGPKIRAVATDGYIIAVAEADAPEGLDFPGGVTLPGKTVTALRRLTPAGGEVTTIQISPTLIEFTLRQVRMTSKVVGYAFADYARFYPAAYGPTVVVDKDLLFAALNRALLFATSTNRRVKIDLQPGLIKIAARTHSAGEVDDEIEAAYEGEPFSIVFNAKRMHDILAHVDASRVEIAFTSPKTLFRVRGEGVKSEHFFLVPIADGLVEKADDQ